MVSLTIVSAPNTYSKALKKRDDRFRGHIQVKLDLYDFIVVNLVGPVLKYLFGRQSQDSMLDC